jgi:hypothetical protein
MTETPPPLGVRIGSVERDAAITALGGHMNAGRLDPDEYGERVGKASVARYSQELVPLFSDLPSGPPSALAVPAHPPAVTPNPVFIDDKGRQPMFGRAGTVAVKVSPFVAVALFFALAGLGVGAAWLAFMLVPAAGAVVYGGAHHNRR